MKPLDFNLTKELRSLAKKLITLADAIDGREYVSVAEAAQLLGVTENRVQALCRQGRMGAAKLGRQFVIPRKDLERFATKPRAAGRPRARDEDLNPEDNGRGLGWFEDEQGKPCFDGLNGVIRPTKAVVYDWGNNILVEAPASEWRRLMEEYGTALRRGRVKMVGEA